MSRDESINKAVERMKGMWNKPRPSERIPELLQRLRWAWTVNPDMRLGQLIECVMADKQGPDLFNIEDEELVKRVEKFVRSSPEPSRR